MRALLLLLGVSIVSGVSGAAVSKEVTSLRDSLAKTQKLSARFEQTRHWAALKDALVTQGSIQYEKGKRLVWKTEAPSESELILVGTTATMSYPALHTTQTVDLNANPGMGKVFETIRSVLEADLSKLEPVFDIKVTQKSPLKLALHPKVPALAQAIQGLELAFDARFRLLQVVLREPSGDWTDIAFRDHHVVTGP